MSVIGIGICIYAILFAKPLIEVTALLGDGSGDRRVQKCSQLAICITGGFRGGDDCTDSHVEAIWNQQQHWEHVGLFLATWLDRACTNRSREENRGQLRITETYLRQKYSSTNIEYIYVGDPDEHGAPSWVYNSQGYQHGEFPQGYTKLMFEGTYRMMYLWEKCVSAVPRNYDVIMRFRFDVCLPMGWTMKFTCPPKQPSQVTSKDVEKAREATICWENFEGANGEQLWVELEPMVKLNCGPEGGPDCCKQVCNKDPRCNSFKFCGKHMSLYESDTCELHTDRLPLVGNKSFYTGGGCATFFRTSCREDQVVPMRHLPQPRFSVSYEDQSYMAAMEVGREYLVFHGEHFSPRMETYWHHARRWYGLGTCCTDESCSRLDPFASRFRCLQHS